LGGFIPVPTRPRSSLAGLVQSAAGRAVCSVTVTSDGVSPAAAFEKETVIMSRILVLYGTTHGHTAKVARSLAETLRSQGAAVDVHYARSVDRRPDEYDGVIVAASVRGGKYQKAVWGWVRSHRAVLNAKPTAFVSVCLGVLQRDPKVDHMLKTILQRFLDEAGWQPTVTKIVAGALLYTRYNWFIRWFMKRIVAKAGGDTDTTRDYEYTDWTDLRAFAEQFGRMVEGHPMAIPAARAPLDA
jgi:menaquinone-dependent protoporphyrinogen oxidase